MPTPDKNFLSFVDIHHAPGNPRVYLNLRVCPEDYKVELLQSGARISSAGVAAEEVDDVLKISGCTGVEFDHLQVVPVGVQREDAVDIMRFSRGISIKNALLRAGKYAVTIKGGSRDILLQNVRIERPSQGWEKVDIDLGNYSHNAQGRTTGVVLWNVTRSDGKPVRVRVGWADEPIVIGGNVEILRVQSRLLKAYVWVKLKLSGYRGAW